jgi:capsule polysaccharide modification protein KpsS
MIYNLSDPPEYQKALEQFKAFMGDFSHPEDIQAIINLIESTPSHDAKALRKLELLVAKVEALQNEDYEKLEGIRNELGKLGS